MTPTQTSCTIVGYYRFALLDSPHLGNLMTPEFRGGQAHPQALCWEIWLDFKRKNPPKRLRSMDWFLSKGQRGTGWRMWQPSLSSPLPWYKLQQNANLGMASSLNLPTRKLGKLAEQIFHNMFSFFCRFALDLRPGQRAGTLTSSWSLYQCKKKGNLYSAQWRGRTTQQSNLVRASFSVRKATWDPTSHTTPREETLPHCTTFVKSAPSIAKTAAAHDPTSPLPAHPLDAHPHRGSLAQKHWNRWWGNSLPSSPWKAAAIGNLVEKHPKRLVAATSKAMNCQIVFEVLPVNFASFQITADGSSCNHPLVEPVSFGTAT